MSSSASARGLATLTHTGTVLDVWYPAPKIDEPVTDTGTERLGKTPQQFAALAGPDETRGVARVPVLTRIGDLGQAPVDAYDVYLRLHLLSHRLCAPGEINLDGARDHLANVVWTNYGPCAMEDFQMIRGQLAGSAPVTVFSVDKFPRMLDYVVPDQVTVIDSGRVRLGAYLAPGTVVGADAFIDYGAGTLSAVTVTGRLCFGETLG